MSVTAEVSQDTAVIVAGCPGQVARERGMANLFNMSIPMFVTAEVSQEPIGWLKFSAELNMPSHVGHCRSVPGADRLVEGLGRAEHFLHVWHSRSVPGADRLVEVVGSEEHVLHVCHRRSVPGPDRLVEGLVLALQNMDCMSVTAEVSQDPIGWLNFSAPFRTCFASLSLQKCPRSRWLVEVVGC